MKPRPFAYVRPTSVEEAVALLTATAGALPLAGGQSLVPALILREQSAPLLVDVTRLDALRGIAVRDGTLSIGAGQPMWDLERDAAVIEHAPLLVRALQTVGAPGIRSRATLGGSLAWSDPTSQLPATLLALDATIVTTTRRVSAAALLALERGTALAHGELVVSIELRSQAGAGHGLSHVRRSHITWPVAGAVALTRPGFARVALYGAAPRPICAEQASGADAITAVLAMAAPFADERASAAYRSSVLPTLAGRALAEAGRH